MAHKHAAIKALRQTAKRTEANTAVKRNITYLRKQAVKAVKDKDIAGATEMFKKMISMVDKAAQRNVIKKNNAARKKSRLAHLIASITVDAKSKTSA